MQEEKVKTDTSKKINIEIEPNVADLDSKKTQESAAEKEFSFVSDHINGEKMVKLSENDAKKRAKDEISVTAGKSVKEGDSVEKTVSITPEMIMKSIEKVQREIWYTRIALAIFLIINLVYIKLCISNINDTMSMFLQFLMGAMDSD